MNTLASVSQQKEENEQLQANAYASYYQAESLRKSGMSQEQSLLRQGKYNTGQAEASIAGSGVVLSEGSALDAIKNSVYTSTKDAMQTRENTYANARNAVYQAGQYESSKKSNLDILFGSAGAMQKDATTFAAFM